MKNTILTISALVFVTCAMAQIPKGTSTIGGSLSLSHKNNDYTSSQPYIVSNSKYKETSISLAPGYGYFLTNNFCVGLNLNAALSSGKSTYENNPEQKSDTQTLGAGPFLRYYIPLDSKLYAYGAGAVNFLRTRIKGEYYNTATGLISEGTQKIRSTTYDLGLGLAYFLNPNTAIEGGMLFMHNNQRSNGEKTNTLALNIGFRIFLHKG